MKRASMRSESARKMAGTDIPDHLPENEGPTETGLTREIPLEMIVADPDQPRKSMPEEGLQELAASIKEVGILQPILVSRHGKDS
ncbi:MAG: ParB N-terminal domain-containing protein, partial [Methanothrix sp.]